MHAVPFPEANRVFHAPKGQEENVYSLHVHATSFPYEYKDAETGEQKTGEMPMTLSKWQPDPADVIRITAGMPIWLSIWGEGVPPVRIATANPFEDQKAPQAVVNIVHFQKAIFPAFMAFTEHYGEMKSARIDGSDFVAEFENATVCMLVQVNERKTSKLVGLNGQRL